MRLLFASFTVHEWVHDRSIFALSFTLLNYKSIYRDDAHLHNLCAFVSILELPVNLIESLVFGTFQRDSVYVLLGVGRVFSLQ
jgi:hypothetical protein